MKRLHTDGEILKVYPFSTRLAPHTIPSPDICDEPTVCVSLNASWASHIASCLATLTFEDMWLGTPEEVYSAIQNVYEVMNMFSNPCDSGETAATLTLQMNILNQTINQNYDGTLASIDRDVPTTDFNNDPDDTGEDGDNRDSALCYAVTAMVEMLCAQALSALNDQTKLVAILAGVSAFIFGPIGAIAGMISTGLANIVNAAQANSFKSEEAKLNVACCLLTYLTDRANTFEEWRHMADDCFPNESSFENDIAQTMILSNFFSLQNYVVFNKALAEGFRYAEIGFLGACPCSELFRLSGFGNHQVTSLSIGGAPAATYNSENDTYTGGFNQTAPNGNGGRLFDLRLVVDASREIIRIKLITSTHRTRDSGADNFQIIAYNGVDLQSTQIEVTVDPQVIETEWTGSVTGANEVRFYAGVEVISSGNGNISATRLEVEYAL